jgi:hypothetical protein
MKASGPFVPDWARPEDDAALRRLLRETPMDGRIRISLEREPGLFRAAEIEGGIHHCAVARDPSNGVPIAMCSRLVRRMWVNGERRPAGYLTQLHHNNFALRGRGKGAHDGRLDHRYQGHV